jgi:hypothetical protein
MRRTEEVVQIAVTQSGREKVKMGAQSGIFRAASTKKLIARVENEWQLRFSSNVRHVPEEQRGTSRGARVGSTIGGRGGTEIDLARELGDRQQTE